MVSINDIAILTTCLASLGQSVKVFNCDGECVNIEISCDDTARCKDDASLLDFYDKYNKIFPPPPVVDTNLMKINLKVIIKRS